MASTGLTRGGPRERQYRAAFAQDNVQPASLQQQLLGRDTIYGGQGEAPDYDWSQYGQVPPGAFVLRARQWARAIQAYEDSQPASPLGTLRGQDRVYGGAGQAPDYDWPNPTLRVNRTGALRAQDTLDALCGRFGDVLIGHDRIYGPDGMVAEYDWPNPTRVVDRAGAQRTLDALGTRFANLYTVVQNPLVAADWPLPVRPRDALSGRRSQDGLGSPPTVRNPSSAQPALGNPVAAQMNTTFTNDLSADGFTWAQGAPSFEDKYGNPICLVQRDNDSAHGGAKQHNFVYSNTAGASWTDAGIAETAIDRGACAYDGGHDLIHVAMNGQSVSDGIFYRRYLISYTAGTTSISGIARLDSVSVILDNQQSGETVSYQHPTALFCEDVTLSGEATTGNTLVVVYGISNTNVANPGYEVRAVARALTYDANDGTAGNWRSITSSGGAASGSTSLIGNTPVTGSYRRLGGSTSALGTPYPTVGRVPFEGSSKGGVFVYWGQLDAWRRCFLTYSTTAGAVGWTPGSTTTLDAMALAGTDAGYALKHQLASKITFDPTNRRHYLAYPVWKSDSLGDTLRVSAFNSQTLSRVATLDLYSAGGSNTDVTQDMFVAGDVQWDDVSGALVVVYGDLPRHDVYAATCTTDLALVGAAPLAVPSVFATAPCDIPTIHPSRVGGKTALVFRDFNAGARNNPPTYTPPYTGWWLTLDWVDPRPQEASVYLLPSAQRLRPGVLDQFVDLQTTLLGVVPSSPVLALDWPLPTRKDRLRFDHQPLGQGVLELLGQDVLYGPPGMVGEYDYPNPLMRRVRQPEIPPSLLGTLLFVVPPVPVAPLDWQNPLRREPTRDLRLHLATGYPLQLRGQDAVYGPPGMVPAYDWTGVPKGRPPGVVTNRQHLVNLVLGTLAGQDRIWAGAGQVPTRDLETQGITPRGQQPRILRVWRAVLAPGEASTRTGDGIVFVSLGSVTIAVASPTVGMGLIVPSADLAIVVPTIDLDLGG